MTYTFNLEWNELPEEFKQEKIEEYLENCLDEELNNSDDLTEEERKEIIAEYQDKDGEWLKKAIDHAEYQIEAHFPIYF